jgi:hypothetical protein
MKKVVVPAGTAEKCDERAEQVKSVGDREQLISIANRLRTEAREKKAQNGSRYISKTWI